MSVILQYNGLTHNEAARKAMESYTGILQKAFEHYQNLWQDYIKLQEKCGQCNVPSSSQMIADTPPCTETNEAVSQHLNNTTVQESNSIPLLELETMNISPINSETESVSLDASVSLHKNIDENDPPKSPIFLRTSLWAGNRSAKKSVRSPKARYNNSTSDMKSHQNLEKVSSKYNHKLEISTTHHVETTFLPNGKRLKQSRLAFHPVENNEKTRLSSSVDKHKTANAVLSVKQSFSKDFSVANATLIKNDTINDHSETSEDVIEISPTQRNVTSNVKRCLKLKRKIPTRHMRKIFPSKNKCFSSTAAPDIIDEIDFGLCPSPKRTSTQMEDVESLMNTAVNILNDNTSSPSPRKMHNKTDIRVTNFIEAQKNELKKDHVLITKVSQSISDFACEDETFYLPAEQAANRNDMDLDDAENKPPEKMMFDDASKFNVVPKRKADISEQLNMRCKADRAKLNGWDCWECKEYYENLSLSKEELQKRKNQCSRHRHKYERPNTPEGFWNPEFPETLSCTYRQNKS